VQCPQLYTSPFPVFMTDIPAANNIFRQFIKLRVNKGTSTVPVQITMASHTNKQKSIKKKQKKKLKYILHKINTPVAYYYLICK